MRTLFALLLSVVVLGEKIPTYPDWVMPTYLNSYIPVWEIGSQEMEHGVVSVFYWLDKQVILTSQSNPSVSSSESRKIATAVTNKHPYHVYFSRYMVSIGGRTSITTDQNIFPHVKFANYDWSYKQTNTSFPVLSQMCVRTRIKVGANIAEVEPSGKWVCIVLEVTLKKLPKTDGEQEGAPFVKEMTLHFPLGNGTDLEIPLQHELVYDPKVVDISITFPPVSQPQTIAEL